MTIYALSTGPGISGIAIVRVSGKETKTVIKLLTGLEIPKPRVATLRKINKIVGHEYKNAVGKGFEPHCHLSPYIRPGLLQFYSCTKL